MQLLPKIRAAVQIPEMGDDAALRQTLLTLRDASSVNHRTVTKVEASMFRAYSRSHGRGSIVLELKDHRGRWDRNTRVEALPTRRNPDGSGGVIPGDFVVILGGGRFQVVPGLDFESVYCFGTCVEVPQE